MRENMLAHSKRVIRNHYTMRNMCSKTVHRVFFQSVSLVLQWLLIQSERLTSHKIHTSFYAFYYYSFQFTAIKQLACDCTKKQTCSRVILCHWKLWPMDDMKNFSAPANSRENNHPVSCTYHFCKAAFIDDMTYSPRKSDIIAWALNWQMFRNINAI